MNDSYTPPKVWTWEAPSGGQFASINRPVSGATHDKALPVGRHPFQLYSLATPNGVKVTVMFEELLAAGIEEAEYDAWLIKIGDGDQFGSGFVDRELPVDAALFVVAVGGPGRGLFAKHVEADDPAMRNALPCH